MDPGEIKSLTSFFAVSKGETDTIMVCDGTKSGLNDSMWALWFAMPTVEAHMCFVGTKGYLGDIDVGDMFLNFILHEYVRKVSGANLTPFSPEELLKDSEKRVVWEHWTRCRMGFKSSPYNAIQAILFAEEQIRGGPKDPSNILRWDLVILNPLGSPGYEPSLPWDFRVRSGDGLMTCDFNIYVDDVQSAENSWLESRECAR
jgi:hypothetical protein